MDNTHFSQGKWVEDVSRDYSVKKIKIFEKHYYSSSCIKKSCKNTNLIVDTSYWKYISILKY